MGQRWGSVSREERELIGWRASRGGRGSFPGRQDEPPSASARFRSLRLGPLGRRVPPTQRDAAAPLPEKVREPGGGRAGYRGRGWVGVEGGRLAGVPRGLRGGGGRGLNCLLPGAPRGPALPITRLDCI